MILTKPIVLLTVTLNSTIIFILFFRPNPLPPKQDTMARSFVLWLHGLGDSGPANEPIKTLFTSPEFRFTKWSFPSAPNNPVTCNCKFAFLFYGVIIVCGFFETGFVLCGVFVVHFCESFCFGDPSVTTDC